MLGPRRTRVGIPAHRPRGCRALKVGDGASASGADYTRRRAEMGPALCVGTFGAARTRGRRRCHHPRCIALVSAAPSRLRPTALYLFYTRIPETLSALVPFPNHLLVPQKGTKDQERENMFDQRRYGA